MGKPIDEVREGIIKQGLALLHEVAYFEGLAQEEMNLLANSFESVSENERVMLVAKTAAARNKLLFLAGESSKAAEELADSKLQENQNEIDLE